MRSRMLLGLCLLLTGAAIGCQASSPSLEDEGGFGSSLQLDGVELTSIQRRGAVDIRPTGDSIRILGEGGSQLGFQFRLNPTATYRLGWSGSASGPAPVLRLGYRGLRYYGPPNRFELTLPAGIATLELLVHSGGGYDYTLDRLTLRECQGCFSDADLIERLRREIPELDRAIETVPLAAARLLLDWAANAGDYAYGTEVANPSVVSFASASDLFQDRFSRNGAGVYCGGFALFYDKILKLFDYPSFTVDFGRGEAGLTHVTVVVPHRERQGWRFYIFDPTFNMVFRDEHGYADIERILDGGGDGLRAISLPLDRRDFIVAEKLSDFCTEVKGRREGLLVCSRPDYGFEYYLKAHRKTFIELGWPPSPEGFFKLLRERVFSLGPTLDPAAKRQFRRLLEARNIPIGPQG